MRKLDFSREALDFLNSLQEKQHRQIVYKLHLLLTNARPQDSRKLKDADEYYRVDSGEYRIVYSIQETILQIFVIGKRNDDDVYRKFKRMK